MKFWKNMQSLCEIAFVGCIFYKCFSKMESFVHKNLQIVLNTMR